MKIAVVTGASSGFGQEFVKRFAQDEQLDEIWVIARREERLNALKESIQAVKLRPIPMDLCEMESLDKYRMLLEAEKPEVRILVNNSGYGVFGAFTERDLDKQLGIIDLNDRALVGLTYLTLPYMKAGGEVYNVSSSSSFQPVPYIAVYGASKAFVLNFSRAIARELKPKGIRVMAVCPHWCKTEFFDTAVTDDTIVHYDFFNDKEAVVVNAIRDMKKGKDVSTCGFMMKLRRLLIKLLPQSLIMTVWLKQQKKPN